MLTDDGRVEADDYARKWLERIKQSDDGVILSIINRIYEDGFNDGYTAGAEEELNN